MNDSPPTPAYSGQATLARSLFGFALFAWLPLLISWLLLLFSPPSPDAAYERWRHFIIGGVGLLVLLGFWLCIKIYRFDGPRQKKWARAYGRLFARPWPALLALALLVEANMLALLITGGIAPSITAPARFLLFCWSLLFAGMLLTWHWAAIKESYLRRRDAWALAGISLGLLAALALVFFLSSQLVAVTGLADRLRGGLDYRKLHFIAEGEAPSAAEFWAEQGQTQVRWLPYSYWTVAPFQGDFINVDDQGLRRTAQQASADASTPKIFFFGGSTVWGEGARDAYTIPSQVAQLLEAAGQPAQVSNYGQTGYVSSQDFILFQAQLARGNRPDLAVFYQGFNDVYAAQLQGKAGVTLRENERANDVEMSRLLRRGQPVLRAFMAHIEADAWSLVATSGASAAEIGERWAANRRLIRALADEYGLRVLFVWQPALFAKESLTASEAHILGELEQSGFVALYKEVDGDIRARAQAGAWTDFLWLTDLFSQRDDEIFFDRVHINERGNQVVAEAIAQPILQMLKSD